MKAQTEVTSGRSWMDGKRSGAFGVQAMNFAVADRGLLVPFERRDLAATSCFAGLDDGCLAILRQIAVRRSFANGQTIHTQGDSARFLDVIVAGHVRLSYLMEDGSTVLHTIVPRGETFGEVGVLEQCSHLDMAVAAGPVTLTSLPTAALFALAAERAEIARALRLAAANRCRDYVALIRDLSLQSLPARLAQVLIRIADRIGTPVKHGGRPAHAIGAMVSQSDLALMARGSRGNVNRALQGWQRSGWVAVKDRSILVLDRAALAALALRDGD